MKFNPSKNELPIAKRVELSADPFVKIKSRKTENRPFAEFKYLEKTNIGEVARDAQSFIRIIR